MSQRVVPLMFLAAILLPLAAWSGLLADPATAQKAQTQPVDEKDPFAASAGKKTEATPMPPVVQISSAKAPGEDEIRKALGKRIEVDFDKLPLNKVVQSLEKATGVNFLLNEQALSEDGIPTDHPISLKGKPLAAARLLDRILEPLDLAWFIHNHVVHITTEIVADEVQVTRTYAIGDLVQYAKEHSVEVARVQPKANLQFVQFGGGMADGGPGSGTGGFSPGYVPAVSTPTSWLIDALQEMTDGPWVDIDGTGGTISSISDNTLIIRQTYKVQMQCKAIIDTIREFTNGELTPNPTAIRPPYYAKEEDETVKKALAKVISVKAQHSPLNQFLAEIAKKLDVPMSVSQRDLDDEGIAVDQPISLDVKDIPAESVLKLALEPWNLQALVVDGQLYVTTEVEADDRLFVNVYDVRDLSGKGIDTNVLVDPLRSETSGPWIDIDGTGGQIAVPVEGLLLIRQTQTVHEEIVASLNDLRQKTAQAAKGPEKGTAEDPKAMATKFYNVFPDGQPSNFQKAILTLVEPESWKEQGGEGEMVIIGTTLVIKNRNAVQDQIEQFLKDYRNAATPGVSFGFSGPTTGNQVAPLQGGGFFRVAPEKPVDR